VAQFENIQAKAALAICCRLYLFNPFRVDFIFVKIPELHSGLWILKPFGLGFQLKDRVPGTSP